MAADLQTRPKARWFAVGNTATGFVAVGNVVTGVFAFGNVARGVVAVGNLAIGVVAIGNVGFGVIGGGGATIAVGLLAGAGVIAIPVLGGIGGVQTLTDGGAIFGLLPIVAWLIGGFVARGRLPAEPGLPPLVPLSEIARGTVETGWVLAQARGLAGNRLLGRIDRAKVELELTPAAKEALEARPKGRWILRVDREERLEADAQGYRDAPTERHVLRCLEAQFVPPVPLWTESSGIQYVLASAWRVGAAVGAVAWLALRLLG